MSEDYQVLFGDNLGTGDFSISDEGDVLRFTEVELTILPQHHGCNAHRQKYDISKIVTPFQG